MRRNRETRWIAPVLSLAVWATACGGTASESAENAGDGDAAGDGDGDLGGDGDSGGDGDISGDGDVVGVGGTVGDGDVVGIGGTLGDGDVGGDGDLVGVGGTPGDGDVGGDGDLMATGGLYGDGDVGGDGDIMACTDVYVFGLTVDLLGAAYPPPPEGTGTDLAPGAVPPDADRIAPPDDPVPVPVPPCEGSVVATAGDYVEELYCQVVGQDCSCQGLGERPGTYSVTATWGNLTETQEVTLGFDGCHVVPEHLTFFDE